jgi:hypothetical protein
MNSGVYRALSHPHFRDTPRNKGNPHDQVQLTAVDPPSECHEQQLKRLKWWEHCSAVYRLTIRRESSTGRLAVLRSRRSNFWTLRGGRLVLSPPEVWFSGLYGHVGRLVPGVQCC